MVESNFQKTLEFLMSENRNKLDKSSDYVISCSLIELFHDILECFVGAFEASRCALVETQFLGSTQLSIRTMLFVKYVEFSFIIHIPTICWM